LVTLKGVLNLTKDVIKAYITEDPGDAIDVAENLFEWGGTSIDDQIEAMNLTHFCLAQAQDWKMVTLDYNNLQFAPVSAAWMEAQDVGFTRGSPYDASSHTATVASGGLVMFERLYNPNDPATNGPWKNIIADNRPDTQFDPWNPGQVFDWRMALPGFMRLLAARVAMIAMMDPNFAENGLWNAELGDGDAFAPGYRAVLKDRLEQMIAGVRCDFKDRLRRVYDPYTYPYYPPEKYRYDGATDIACADVNTGISETTTHVRPDASNCTPNASEQTMRSCLAALPSQADVVSLIDGLRRQLLKKMPIFEVQAAIDVLHLYTHPAPDLTEAFGRIPINANPGLCVDVPGADPTPGTPIQLYGCHGGTAQQFAYDRATETIRNPALDRCLQVRPITFNFPWPIGTISIDNLAQGVAAEIAICNPALDRQRWTYDPQGGIIRSALGTVLDVQWGWINWHATVWLWDYWGGAAQVWRADHSNDYCYGICNPSCYAQCSGLGPGTGSCMGGCMGGCMGSCMTSWP
jgi:hypothetical protein